MSDVILKEECTETRDILISRPIEGRVKIFDQGKGIKRSTINVMGDLGGGSCKVYSGDCSGNAQIGTTETVYSGTPYKISTIRCAE